MKSDVKDLAAIAPRDDRSNPGSAWHWFWAKVFGQRVPTSGDRAHIDNLLVTYRPNSNAATFERDGGWSTDARRVYRIGNLYVFDYADAEFEILTPSIKLPPQNISDDNAKLLAHNVQAYPQ